MISDEYNYERMGCFRIKPQRTAIRAQQVAVQEIKQNQARKETTSSEKEIFGHEIRWKIIFFEVLY